MKCPKCNSENVQVQAKRFEPKMIGACCLAFGGFGCVFLGIVGAVIGAVIGLIVGIVVDSLVSNTYQSVIVCQNCGYVSRPITQTKIGTEQHPLFCNSEESNLVVVRNDVVKGTIIVVRVKIDNYPHFDIGDNSTANLKVTEGVHSISYEQLNGMGRKKNKGQLSVFVGDKKSVNISFTHQGLYVSQSESQSESQPITQVKEETQPHPTFCSFEESNLLMVRTSFAMASKLEIQIDGFLPFLLGAGEKKHIKLENGVHKVAYRKANGMWETVDVIIEEKRRLVQFDFLQQGINVLIQ